MPTPRGQRHGTPRICFYRLLQLQLAVAIGYATGSCTFVRVEFGPDREVVGDFQRLIDVQVKLLGKVEDAPLAGEFGGGSPVENDVVVLGVLTGVGVGVHY